jgi:ATP-binding cassette subfamily F protein uup
MDRLVDHLFVFEGDGAVRDFPGNYTLYRIALKEEAPKKKTQEILPKINAQQIITTPPPVEKRKLSFNEKREFEQLSKDIPALEKEKVETTEKMTGSRLPYEELEKLSDRILEITQLLEEKELRWLELSENA